VLHVVVLEELERLGEARRDHDVVGNGELLADGRVAADDDVDPVVKRAELGGDRLVGLPAHDHRVLLAGLVAQGGHALEEGHVHLAEGGVRAA